LGYISISNKFELADYFKVAMKSIKQTTLYSLCCLLSVQFITCERGT